MRLHYLLFAALFAAMGCSKTDLQAPATPETPGEQTGKIVLKASTGTSTKVEFEDEGAQGIKVTWSSDDTFSLYNALDGTWAADFKITKGAGTTDGEFEKIKGDLTDNTKYAVLFPAIGGASMEEYLRLPFNQTQIGNGTMSHMGKITCMAQMEYTYNKAEPMNISFVHMFAMMTMNIPKPAGYDETVNGKPTKIILNLYPSAPHTINLVDIDWKTDIKAYAMVMLGDYNKHDNISISVETDKGFYYSHVQRRSQDYQEGKRYTVNCTMAEGFYLYNARNIPLTMNNITILDAGTPAGGYNDLIGNISNHTQNVSITMPNLEGLADNAFQNTTKLANIDLPKVTTIGIGAFDGCTSLTTVNFPEATSVGNTAFRLCDKLSNIDLPKVTSIGIGAFDGCTSLTTVNFPEATSVGNSAFNLCDKLSTIDLPKVTTIGDNAFDGCTSLMTVNFPEVTSVGNSAFNLCDKLIIIDLPKVNSIGAGAFDGIGTSLPSGDINLGTGISGDITIDQPIFEGTYTEIYTLTLGDGVTGVKDKVWKAGGTEYIFSNVIRHNTSELDPVPDGGDI